jgi:CRP/FNR family cyclic AMP-dependent transcriptional regulator
MQSWLDSSSCGWRGDTGGGISGKPKACVPSSFSMTKRYILTEKRKALASSMLAQKIGYLKVEHLPPLPRLPIQSFNAHRIIRPKNELFVIQQGIVEIWHTAHDMFVAPLEARSIFGELPLLGQTMLDCRAIAAAGGVTVGVMSLPLASELIASIPLIIFEEIGPRLAHAQAEHYRTTFQTVESRLAGLLLKLAGGESSVTGFTQGDLAAQLATYRETVTNVMDSLREDRLIEIGRKKITILNKKALKELSEM